jgi:hypothetical protein
MESKADRIKRWRGTAHYWLLTARDCVGDEDGADDAVDIERATRAASLATAYFAAAIDAEVFGDLPEPELKLWHPEPGITLDDIYGSTEPPEGSEAEPARLDFEQWCQTIKGMTSRSRRRVAVDKLPRRQRAWWDEQMARDPKWLAWN